MDMKNDSTQENRKASEKSGKTASDTLKERSKVYGEESE